MTVKKKYCLFQVKYKSLKFGGLKFLSDGALPITDLRFTALSFTAASIEWTAAQRQCDNGFDIKLVSSLSLNVSTSLTTSVNVTGLSRAVEYNITVTGVSDGNEVTGNKANLLMALDGKYN